MPCGPRATTPMSTSTPRPWPRPRSSTPSGGPPPSTWRRPPGSPPRTASLDIGSGLGGPARLLARRVGCQVVGLDLTPELCEVAADLTRRVHLEDRVEIRQGDALALPFDDGSFDVAWTQHASMNIADKGRLYAEAPPGAAPGRPPRPLRHHRGRRATPPPPRALGRGRVGERPGPGRRAAHRAGRRRLLGADLGRPHRGGRGVLLGPGRPAGPATAPRAAPADPPAWPRRAPTCCATCRRGASPWCGWWPDAT